MEVPTIWIEYTVEQTTPFICQLGSSDMGSIVQLAGIDYNKPTQLNVVVNYYFLMCQKNYPYPR